jgi:ABC-2 type transport system ATP-binding protein/lipopolysaccharide transport system ATP-binding protein
VVSVTLSNVSLDIPIYDIGASSLRKMVLSKTVGGRFGQAGTHINVHALRNVSFEAKDGDRIALVGSNGSGKSTLLRVLSDVYAPTGGIVNVQGKVSPMFDTTLGMTMDATGYENIQICARLWGLSPAQIAASLDDIVSFTELGDYLDVPVRTYSTGMMLRLAFAIATVRDPEILLLDEIIGVGDTAFFAKAFERLKSVVARSRIIFVASHADSILKLLCDKAIWLHQGALMEYGPIDDVIKSYRQQVSGEQASLQNSALLPIVV